MKFEIYKSKSDFNFYWRLYYNGNIIATGHEGHSTAYECEQEISKVKSTNSLTPITKLNFY